MKAPKIISIQSQLVFGCAGNNAAIPLLQGLGATIYSVPTTLLSNTPHYETIAGGPIESDLISDLLARLLERVDPKSIDGVLTGYMATPGAISAAFDFIRRLKNLNPDVTYLCDPVMGDTDVGLYVPDDVADGVVRTLSPIADVLTPNLFEYARIFGIEVAGPDKLVTAMNSSGFNCIIVTGVDSCPGRLASLMWFENALHRVETTRYPINPTGTGDLFAARFLYEVLRGVPRDVAHETSVHSVCGIVQRCFEDGETELRPERIFQ